jgi:predicted lipoprotein with Yx(FWY)xxD motif
MMYTEIDGHSSYMRTSTIVWTIIILAILVGGWYVWMQSPVPAPAPTSTTAPASTSAASTSTPSGDGSSIADNLTLGTDATSSLGIYLIAYNGMALYTYSGDSAGVSNCSGSCAQNWPPYTVPAGMHLNLEAGVTGTAGTVTRADGTTQVTYKGMPLYFFVGDSASGAVTGDGVGGFSIAKP